MYPNVRAEMARRKITLSMLSEDERLNFTPGSLSKKLNGKVPITFDEAVAIKDAIGTELPLEELFKQEDEE